MRFKKYGKALEEACKKVGCKFLGIWRPGNDKYHHVAMIEVESADEGMKTFFEKDLKNYTILYSTTSKKYT